MEGSKDLQDYRKIMNLSDEEWNILQDYRKIMNLSDEEWTSFLKKYNESKREDELTYLRHTLGYTDKPLFDYSENDNLMDYDGYSKYAKKFDLKKSSILIILDALKSSAATIRSSEKSMMATKSNIITEAIYPESLIQTRNLHMEEVGSIARLIALGLGLNEELAEGIGEGHDIGHTFNGHVGERILSAIGRLNDCTYIVHNAMGPYVLERENIINLAIKKVQQINPKENLEDVKEFMRYVIDGIVSHNGEGTVGKIEPKDKSYEEMQEEIKRCFTEKGFDKTIIPATMEGAIIRYADIIAYTRSDILDGFRLKDKNGDKIISKFDDEYLSIIGTCLAVKNNFEKIITSENKLLLEMYGLSEKIKKIEKMEDNEENRLELERTKKERQILANKYEELKKAKIEYAQRHIDKIKPQSNVKIEITDMMKNEFIKDIVRASKGKPYITMSPLMRRTLFELRNVNVNKIVPYTRKAFETEDLPIAIKSLVDIYTDTIIKTGIAYSTIPEERRDNIKSNFSKEKRKQLENKINEDNTKTYYYEKKMCHYYEGQDSEKLKYFYENALDAMKDIIKHDIAIALEEEEYTGELKEIYMSTKINPIRSKIREMGKTQETMTSKDRELLYDELIKMKEKDIERIIANKMAIEYIGGMTDNTIIWELLNKNLISKEKMLEKYSRTMTQTDTGLKKIQGIFADYDEMIKMDVPDDEISL